MTTRVALLPYGPSDSCRLLRDELNTAFAGNANIRPRLLRSQNSVFVGASDDIIINYGNRSAPASLFGSANVLNSQQALNNAANKLNALRMMRQHMVNTIDFTTSRADAQAWVTAGTQVYARAVLNGHSGEGITTHSATLNTQVPEAPLYTKGITGQRREWRVHVFKGTITYVQVKRRANGYQENPAYQEEVRNHHTGWIYATENINPSQAVLWNAAQAVRALGLDFGAVDIISRGDQAWVLEVNTAAGLSGTNLETFRNALVEYITSRIDRRNPNYTARFPVPERNPNAAPEAPVAEAAPQAASRSVSGVSPIAEALAQAAASAGTGATPVSSVSTSVPTENNRRPDEAQRNRYPDGYYVARVNTLTSTTNGVILYRTGGRWFRHGWNAPVESGAVSSPVRITSITDANGQSVAIDGAQI